MLDAFGREIKASLDDLKAALLQDVGQQKKSAPVREENNEQLKKLNDNLDDIIGGQFNREIKALAKLIKRVADCCEQQGKKREKTHDQHHKAVARAMSTLEKSGTDLNNAFKKVTKTVENNFEITADKTMSFGKVLERSQRRFSAAFGMIGKQFAKDFGYIGDAIRKRLQKLDPFKGFKQEGESTWGMIRRGWDFSLDKMKEKWDEMTTAAGDFMRRQVGKISGWFKGVTDTISGWWQGAINTISGWWSAGAKRVSDAWQSYGKPVLDTIFAPFKAVGKGLQSFGGWAMKYVGPLGKATAGTIKDLFKMGKTTEQTGESLKGVHKETDDLLAEPTKKVMQGEGDAVRTKKKGARTPESDLCRCICHCIGELLGVSKDHLKHDKKADKDQLKADKKVPEIMGGGKRIKGKPGVREAGGVQMASPMIAMQDMARAMERKTESQGDLMKEWIMQERRQRGGAVGARARGMALAGSAAAQRFVFGEKPVEALMAGFAQAIAKVSGKVIEGPFALIGDIVEKSTIPGLTALGPVIKVFGSALGGLAEGLINFVLTPLIEQVEHMNEASQAMYISTGATIGAPTVKIGQPAPGGEEWTVIAKRVAEYNTNMDSASRTLEKLGAYMDDVSETGQRFNVIQKEMLKNFKRGIQETKTLNKVTKSGLQTAYLIGASAESTADLFADWHQRLGMSTTDLRGMQRNLTQIARSTGIFGDELIQIAKSSHQFMENMRMAGNLSTTAAKNILELTARGRKTGTEGATGRVLDLLSKGILRGGGGPKEQALAAIGGGGNPRLAQKALMGTLLDADEDVAAFAKNLENWTRKLIKADPTKTLEENIKRLTPEQRARFTAIMEQTVGVGLNEMAIVVNNLKETSKSFGERLEDFAKQARGPAMSIEQLRGMMDKAGGKWRKTFDELVEKAHGDTGKALDEMLNMYELPKELRKELQGQLSAQQADFQRQQLFIKTGADLIDAFNKNVAEGGKGWDEAIADLSKTKNFREYLKELGTDATKGGEAIEKALMDQAKRIRMEARKIGKEEIADMLPTPEEIKKAITGKDTKAMQQIAEDFSRAQGVLAKQAKTAADPVEQIKQSVYKIEGYFKELMQSAIFQILPFIQTAINELQNAPFWKAFREGDIQKGIELLGDFISHMADNIIKGMGQIQNLENTPGFQKFVASIVKGVATIAKPLLDAIGNYIKENAPGLAKFWEKLKTIDWDKVGEGIGVVLGLLAALGSIFSVGGVLAVGIGALIGLLLGGGGLVVAFGALAGAMYYLHGKIKENDAAIQAQGKAFEQQAKDIAKAGEDRRNQLISGNLTKDQVQAEKEGAAQRLAAAKAAQDQLNKNFSINAYGTLESLTGGFYGEGTRNTQIQGKIAAEAAAREAKQAEILTKYSDKIANATTKEEKERQQELALRDAYSDNMAVANIKLAKTMEIARNELKKGADGLQQELNEIQKRSNKRFDIGIKTTKLFYGTTKEEDEAFALLPKLQEQKNAYMEKEFELVGKLRQSLQKKDEKGNVAWLNIEEAGKRWQNVTKDVDKSAAKQFESSQSLGEMERMLMQERDKAWNIYQKLPDTEEGLKKSIEMAESYAKKLNAYEAARAKIVQGMLKDEQGRITPFEQVLDKFQETTNRIKPGVYQLKPDKDAAKLFKEKATLDELESFNKTVNAQFKDQYTKAQTLEQKTALLEKASGVKTAYELRKAEIAKENIMTKDAQGYTRKVAPEIAAENLKQVLKPQDIGEEIVNGLKGAKTQEDLKKLSEAQLAPLREQYKEANFSDAADIANKMAKIMLATELLQKQLAAGAPQAMAPPNVQDPAAKAAIEAQNAPQVVAIDKNTAALEKNADILNQMLVAQNKAAKAGEELKDEAVNKGTLYVEDVALRTLLAKHLMAEMPAITAPGVKTLEWKPGGMAENPAVTAISGGGALAETVGPPAPTMTPKLPGFNVVDELKRRTAEVQGGGDNTTMGNIEANTGTTAVNLRAIGKMIGQIGKMLARRFKKGDGLDGVAGPDYPMDAFFEEILSTEWPGARPGRTVGLEIEYSDLS